MTSSCPNGEEKGITAQTQALLSTIINEESDSKTTMKTRNASSYVLSACFLLGCGSAGGGEFDSADAETAEQDLSASVGICPDATPDLLWHNGITGENQVWCMSANGAALASAFNLHESLNVADDTDWRPLGIVPTSGDDSGVRKNILWYHGPSGATGLWLMSGGDYLGSVMFDSSLWVADYTGWKIVATNDFDNDRVFDIVWHHGETGQLQIWYMNPDMMTLKRAAGFDLRLNTPTRDGWSVVGAPDMNRDGKADLLWHNSQTGQLVVWYLNGIKRTGYGVFDESVNRPASTGWRIAGTDDFNRDGQPDLLWHNGDTGRLQLWYLSRSSFGTSRIGEALLPASLNVPADTGWRVVQE